ncbi:MAG: hypothetical protein B6I38_01360 [Anaerolineaceae bacterium 4572_5.1]|nr:MAG: hypothetical protein B6I38_01360 [Anaerolineaceae bacterium 4572_5.1]
MNNKWWGSPRNLGASAPLQQLSQLFTEEPVLQKAEPLTVRIRGVMIKEDQDAAFFGDNDVIITTTFQFGSEPPVQRLHFMENEVPLGWVGDFFNDVILSTRDFKDKTLTLRVQVYDLDRVPSDLVEGVRAAASSSVVAFPHLATYAGAVAFTVPALLKLVDHLDNHDCILDERFKLEVAEPQTGHKLLQPGYYVGFKNPVSSGYALSQDLKVVTEQGEEFGDLSYAVLEVSRDYYAHHDWDIDQKVAKLVSELNGKGQSGKAALEFLRETLGGYAKMKKLQRTLALSNQEDRTEAEQELLDELLSDAELTPFLPNVV